MKYDLINLNTVMNSDPKLGGLSFLENKRDIPFEIKDIYCIKMRQESSKRFRAYRTCSQLLFCPHGSVKIMLDDGEEVVLDEPQKGLIVYPNTCRELIWNKDDSVLCVAVSEYYDPSKST